jgi:hypothetical protein
MRGAENALDQGIEASVHWLHCVVRGLEATGNEAVGRFACLAPGAGGLHRVVDKGGGTPQRLRQHLAHSQGIKVSHFLEELFSRGGCATGPVLLVIDPEKLVNGTSTKLPQRLDILFLSRGGRLLCDQACPGLNRRSWVITMAVLMSFASCMGFSPMDSMSLRFWGSKFSWA